MGGRLNGRDLVLGSIAGLAVASAAARAGSRSIMSDLVRDLPSTKLLTAEQEAERRAAFDRDWVPSPPSEQSFRQRARRELPACLGRGGSFYHVTTFDRVASVARRGLVIGGGSIENSTFQHFSGRSQGKLFLAAGLDAGIAWWTLIRESFHPEPVLLEVDPAIRRGRSLFHDNKGWRDVECSFYTKKGVAPRFLRYWDPEEDGFVPLSGWAEVLQDPAGARLTRFCPYTEEEWADGDDEDDEIHFAPAGAQR